MYFANVAAGLCMLVFNYGMKIIPDRQQFVSFPIYKLDPAWRRLPAAERSLGKAEFIEVVESMKDRMIVPPYSVVGICPDSDIFLWRITYEEEAIDEVG
jgi:hypothetical protein